MNQRSLYSYECKTTIPVFWQAVAFATTPGITQIGFNQRGGSLPAAANRAGRLDDEHGGRWGADGYE
jgi:hypothetical protein